MSQIKSKIMFVGDRECGTKKILARFQNLDQLPIYIQYPNQTFQSVTIPKPADEVTANGIYSIGDIESNDNLDVDMHFFYTNGLPDDREIKKFTYMDISCFVIVCSIDNPDSLTHVKAGMHILTAFFEIFLIFGILKA